MATEEPKYKVINVDGDIEIREYSSYCIAETFIPGTDFNDASSDGFRKLFKFITGNNRSNKKIEMTAPVTTSRSETIEMTAPVTSTRTPDGFMIGFVMPEGFTIETTPTPVDSTIKIREVKTRTVAVIRFSGRWTSSSMDEHQNTLKEWISAQHYLRSDNQLLPVTIPPLCHGFFEEMKYR